MAEVGKKYILKDSASIAVTVLAVTQHNYLISVPGSDGYLDGDEQLYRKSLFDMFYEEVGPELPVVGEVYQDRMDDGIATGRVTVIGVIDVGGWVVYEYPGSLISTPFVRRVDKFNLIFEKVTS